MLSPGGAALLPPNPEHGQPSRRVPGVFSRCIPTPNDSMSVRSLSLFTIVVPSARFSSSSPQPSVAPVILVSLLYTTSMFNAELEHNHGIDTSRGLAQQLVYLSVSSVLRRTNLLPLRFQPVINPHSVSKADPSDLVSATDHHTSRDSSPGRAPPPTTQDFLMQLLRLQISVCAVSITSCIAANFSSYRLDV